MGDIFVTKPEHEHFVVLVRIRGALFVRCSPAVHHRGSGGEVPAGGVPAPDARRGRARRRLAAAPLVRLESLRERVQLLCKFAGAANMLILACSVLAFKFWLLIFPSPLYILSESVLHTIYSVKKFIFHTLHSVRKFREHPLSVLF